MGKLLVVGSVALDSVKTPFGEVTEALGGSATFFCTAASYFADIQLIAVVGEDFPSEHLAVLKRDRVDLNGLERRPGQTFRWRGEYSHKLNEAKTIDTQLNVFETFRPSVPESYRTPEQLFLANIDPELQLMVLEQVQRPSIVALDTMNFWIDGKIEALRKVLRKSDVLIINDGEAQALGGNRNLVQVSRIIRSWGPRTLIIKRGEYGVVMFHDDAVFALPAYPLESLKDPTGAGDSFAGGFMGFLASASVVDEQSFRQAVVYGSVMASFAVQSFSIDRLATLTDQDIKNRYMEFSQLTMFQA
tara:strand:+ start:4039 stop:4947 length:909 start_codon:yes stop_codon:yes gene_type:complete